MRAVPPTKRRGHIKKLGVDLAELARKHPDKKVELWAEDEARLGLQPILRRQWAGPGERPIALHRRAYRWLYAFHFVHPATGKGFWLLMPEANTGVMSVALAEWVKEVNPRADKLLVLLVDQAGWHLSKDLRVPEGVVLYPLPPYSPELQPTECTWPILREALANRLFENWEVFYETLSERCRWMTRNPWAVAARTAWDWIVQAEHVAQSI